MTLVACCLVPVTLARKVSTEIIRLCIENEHSDWCCCICWPKFPLSEWMTRHLLCGFWPEERREVGKKWGGSFSKDSHYCCYFVWFLPAKWTLTTGWDWQSEVGSQVDCVGDIIPTTGLLSLVEHCLLFLHGGVIRLRSVETHNECVESTASLTAWNSVFLEHSVYM